MVEPKTSYQGQSRTLGGKSSQGSNGMNQDMAHITRPDNSGFSQAPSDINNSGLVNRMRIMQAQQEEEEQVAQDSQGYGDEDEEMLGDDHDYDIEDDG